MNASRHAVLDASRLEILSNALNAITEEIQLTLLRSAYSQVVKEAQDASCAIFTAEGRIVAQPVVIPGHLVGHDAFARINLRRFKFLARKPAAIVDMGHVISPAKTEKEGLIYRGFGRGVWTK